MTENTEALQLELEALRAAVRLTEDRLLRVETTQGGLSDKHQELRNEVRSEIKSLRERILELQSKIEKGQSEITEKFQIANSKLDRLFGARAVVTTLITLATSILGSGAVHLAFTVGGP
ncbi:hypothetical protein AA103196_2325 [Ameyamaea chiangmaiensis NBRC 103196]|uniref:Uncharacterized protein n=1 Tax=Ameyamaea chiangmaiensis TaxID=442969 RepID=A0A850P6R3_9PROT|nr:hypothetical protein [Ameyamaea chiangmaiensis]MBS4075416.1 hypothetical protein [Ameyamaea chiangmaiensis]NVN40325.1 hypothetical protein [Ameyamaea chiangmaiensis]GBQ69832.1 hypothetical protein AA103196_2325 [Ameyamaea chiangmaiensis NBRC 103196]